MHHMGGQSQDGGRGSMDEDIEAGKTGWRKEASLAGAEEPVGVGGGRGRGGGGGWGGREGEGGGMGREGGGGGGGEEGEEGEEEEHMQDPAGLALSQSGKAMKGLQVSNQCLIRAFL